MDSNTEKSIGQMLEEEKLTIFKRAGVKARAITSALYSDGSEQVISEVSNYDNGR